MSSSNNIYQELFQAWRFQAKQKPMLTMAFLAAFVTLWLLIIISLVHSLLYGNSEHFRLANYGGLAGFAATAVGSLLVLFLRQVNQSVQDALLGFAAGMMLAASSFSLILPGIEAGEEIFGNVVWAALIVAIGFGLGALVMLGLDFFTPHEHESVGNCGPECQRINGIWLFVFAIALHNIPEGMAIGVSFAQGDLSVGIPLTTAIVLQDIPEGFAVALALRAIGLGAFKSALIGAATGLLEPVGAIMGFAMASSVAPAYPLSMGIAAGAMIFVVSHEVIPETHRNGHQTMATMGLIGGFMVMMFLDTALG